MPEPESLVTAGEFGGSRSITGTASPFVLLDDARPAGRSGSRLYRDPVGDISAASIDEVPRLVDELRSALRRGLHAAGFFGYEAGWAFEPALTDVAADRRTPIAWFGLFETSPELADPEAWLPDPSGAWIGDVTPSIDKEAYSARFDAVQRHIAAGDTYQANLTFQASARFAGSPLALYAALRSRAQADHGAVIWTGSLWVLSLSPELFFSMAGGQIETKPMKGTAARSLDPEADAMVAAQLSADPKQQAENVMIVDLLRNDLGRVAELGSVAVPRLFEVHTYPTVHQLTSTVTARLRGGLDALDMVANSFPCGSVTGAPKIAAMQLLAELEDAPRGVYCGAIGHLLPSGDAAFNVAIRTLVLDEQRSTAWLGLGSGLVADSTVDAEWQECLDKAAFLRLGTTVELFETMRADPSRGALRLDRHLARLSASAEALGLTCDLDAVSELVRSAVSSLDEPARLRLRLRASGAECEVSRLPPAPTGPWSVTLRPLPVDVGDFRLRHKTSDRAFYDRERAACGTDEVVFVRPDGLVTEGSITAVFVPRRGVLLTPRLSSGLLDSVLRRELVDTGRAVPADLTAADLAGGFFVGNSLRGLIDARLVEP
ncbi:MAG: aminodeoxychorismate synthase component I [Propionibacteriaceae bacterium]